MQKIVISLMALLISSDLFSQQVGINEATKLISESKLEEAFTILNKIIEHKDESVSSKVKALRLLVAYPLGTFAYSNRHLAAKKLIEDNAFFSTLKLDDKVFILRTGGLGAFQAAKWDISEDLLNQILELANSTPLEFKINAPHQDDIAITIEYIGWIKLNQKKFSQLIQYWIEELKKRELSPVWREAIIRDLGQVSGEMLFESTEGEFSSCIPALEKFVAKLADIELNKFKSGFRQGLNRSNYEDKKYAYIVKRINESEIIIKITQESILEDINFSMTKPCFLFELKSDKRDVGKSFQEELKNRTIACWNVKKTSASLQNDLIANDLFQVTDELNLELVKAEIAEKLGRFHPACLLAIKLKEIQMAIRTCNQDLTPDRGNTEQSDEIRKSLMEQNDQSIWIGVWDIVFSSINDLQKKSEWLKKYYSTPDSIFELVKLRKETRPLLWWFEDSIDKISKSEQLDSKWSEEFLKSSSPIWQILTLSSEQKYQAIISISISSQNYNPVLENIKDIELSLKPNSNLEKIYMAWLNQYMSANRSTVITLPPRNSRYYNLWLNSLIFISKVKNLDAKEITKWSSNNPKPKSSYQTYIPGIANLFIQSMTSFLKIEKIGLNLKSDKFAGNLTKAMGLLNTSIKNLQLIAQTDATFSNEAEDLRKEFIKKIFVKIQRIQTPADWKKEDQDFWTSEKNKILQTLGGQL